MLKLAKIGLTLGSLLTSTFLYQPAQAACDLDVDGNQQVDALTDGILILRHLFGFSGSALVTGAVGNQATRTQGQAITDWLNGCFNKVAITKDNAPLLWLDTLQATSSLTTFAPQQQGIPGIGVSQHMALLMYQLPAIYQQLFSPINQRAVQEKALTCPNGGSVTTRIDDADNNEIPSSGDLIEMTFNQCGVTYESQSVSVNGFTAIAINSGGGGQLSATLAFANMNYATAQYSQTVNGDMIITRMGDLGTGSYTASGNTLTIALDNTGKTSTLEDYLIRLALAIGEDTAWAYALNAGKITESGSSGYKSVETTQDFTGINFSYPTTGQLVILGKKTANARFESKTIITIIENGVMIETDSNGDGTLESSETYTWEQLYQLLISGN